MILEVDDNGRLERIAVIRGNSDKEVDGRKFFGGYRLKTEYLEVYRLTRKAS